MKRVLFVCTENCCRSPMAEAFTRHYGRGLVEVHSAGVHPAPRVDPTAVQVMAEVGIDISHHQPKTLEDLDVQDYHVVVTVCSLEEGCPVVFAPEKQEWELPDPRGKSLEFFRAVRDDIGERVRQLVEELG
ncbi:MAG: arsenate reductase ArsC [Chloroflexi bacterium]|nr:arsenate reductase ArsC [Chloroflexota bacterium]